VHSINSSNKSNTIMTKNCFTFESKVANVVVSKQVMSLSFSPYWLRVVLDLLQKVLALMLEHGATAMLQATTSNAPLLRADPVA
jgi:hypothetical protein